MVHQSTPSESIKKSQKSPQKKTKAVRRLQFDEDKSSPVSGTIIRDIVAVRDSLQLAAATAAAASAAKQQNNPDEKYEETPLGIQVIN